MDSVVLNAHIHRAATAAHLPPVHSHLLRHTAASLMIAEGAHPKVVQAQHSSIAITMDVYSHLFPTMADDIAMRLERVYRVAATT